MDILNQKDCMEAYERLIPFEKFGETTEDERRDAEFRYARKWVESNKEIIKKGRLESYFADEENLSKLASYHRVVLGTLAKEDINEMDCIGIANLGDLLISAGDFENGEKLLKLALEKSSIEEKGIIIQLMNGAEKYKNLLSRT